MILVFWKKYLIQNRYACRTEDDSWQSLSIHALIFRDIHQPGQARNSPGAQNRKTSSARVDVFADHPPKMKTISLPKTKAEP